MERGNSLGKKYRSVMNSWINSDFTVVCSIGDIVWEIIQADNLEHARAVAIAWDLGRINSSMGKWGRQK